MTETQKFAFRCPPDIADEINQQVEKTGKDRTTVIVEILRRGLSLPPQELQRDLIKSIMKEILETEYSDRLRPVA